MNRKIILASNSPRRKELLSQIEMEFIVVTSNINEDEVINNYRNVNNIDRLSPSELVMLLSNSKALDIYNKLEPTEDFTVIGADTVVALGDSILGKPRNKKEAKNMLNKLSGKTHSVFTGVSLISYIDGQQVVDNFYNKTNVTFFELSTTEIDGYLSTNEYTDKAGAYGIQGIGARLVKDIFGDYNNVVGLPISTIYHKLLQY